MLSPLAIRARPIHPVWDASAVQTRHIRPVLDPATILASLVIPKWDPTAIEACCVVITPTDKSARRTILQALAIDAGKVSAEGNAAAIKARHIRTVLHSSAVPAGIIFAERDVAAIPTRVVVVAATDLHLLSAELVSVAVHASPILPERDLIAVEARAVVAAAAHEHHLAAERLSAAVSARDIVLASARLEIACLGCILSRQRKRFVVRQFVIEITSSLEWLRQRFADRVLLNLKGLIITSSQDDSIRYDCAAQIHVDIVAVWLNGQGQVQVSGRHGTPADHDLVQLAGIVYLVTPPIEPEYDACGSR
jgi:hypothetical protein